jgi:chaperonin GroES
MSQHPSSRPWPLTITPGPGKILVKRMMARAVTDGGILLTNPEAPNEGRVVKVGKKRRHPTSGIELDHLVKQGDRIYFGKYIRTSVEWNGNTFILIEQEDVFAIIEETPAPPAPAHAAAT